MQEEANTEDESLRVSGPNAHGFTHTRLYLVIVWGIALAVLLPLLWNLLVEGLPWLVTQRGWDLVLYGAVGALAGFAWWLAFATLLWITRHWRDVRRFHADDETASAD